MAELRGPIPTPDLVSAGTTAAALQLEELQGPGSSTSLYMSFSLISYKGVI